MEAVKEIHEMMGPYDIVAEIVADPLGDIAPLLSGQIRSIEDVMLLDDAGRVQRGCAARGES